MLQANLSLVQIIVRYDVPLHRYARRLVKDEVVAAALVKEAFEQIYDLNSFDTDEITLRSMLKGHTYKLASLWLLSQPVNNPQNN